MNLSHDALRDLTALTELKSEGGILERHFVLLKEHVMKGRLVGAPSLDGFRMSSQLRRIGGISEKEHAAEVDGKVAEILNDSDCVEVEGDSLAPSSGPPPLRSSCQGETSCRQVRGWSWQQASRSRRQGKAAGCGKHLGRQRHQLLDQSHRQAGKMAYAIYTAVVVKNCCTACTAVHVARTAVYCCVCVLRTTYSTVHELYCTQSTHHFLHSFCLCTAEFSWVPS